MSWSCLLGNSGKSYPCFSGCPLFGDCCVAFENQQKFDGMKEKLYTAGWTDVGPCTPPDTDSSTVANFVADLQKQLSMMKDQRDEAIKYIPRVCELCKYKPNCVEANEVDGCLDWEFFRKADG